MLGEEVRTFVNGKNSAGKYSVVWDGRDNSGSPISSGIYLYQLRLDNNYLKTKKITSLKIWVISCRYIHPPYFL